MDLDLNLIQQGQHLLKQGGIFMWAILAVSVVALMISIEKFLVLQFKYRTNARKLFDTIKRNLIEGDAKAAIAACEVHESSPLANVLRAGIDTAKRKAKLSQVDLALESETLHYIPLISQRLNYLPSLANVATLFGLLGTIAGLIVAFKSTGGTVAGGITQEQGLASGIAIAMYCTAFGLVVAIPTGLAYLYLSNAANRLIDDIDQYSAGFKRLISELGLVQSEEIHIQSAAVESSSEAKSSKKVQVHQSDSAPVESDENTLILKSDPRLAATSVENKKSEQRPIAKSPIQKRSATDVVKPFSEETEKVFANAVSDIQPIDRFAEEKTKVSKPFAKSEQRSSSVEDITDEFTKPDTSGARRP